MSGGWQKSFILRDRKSGLRCRSATKSHRTDRQAHGPVRTVLAALNGVLKGTAPNDYIAQLVRQRRRWHEHDRLAAGDARFGQCRLWASHVLALGGYMSRKSSNSEFAEILIDDVRVISGAFPGPGDPPVPPSIITPPASLSVTNRPPQRLRCRSPVKRRSPISGVGMGWTSWVPTAPAIVLNPTSLAATTGRTSTSSSPTRRQRHQRCGYADCDSGAYGAEHYDPAGGHDGDHARRGQRSRWWRRVMHRSAISGAATASPLAERPARPTCSTHDHGGQWRAIRRHRLQRRRHAHERAGDC